MADHRQIIEKVFDVVHQRLEQAEKIGLQKLDEMETRGHEELERATQRHQRQLRKITKRRHRAQKRVRRRKGEDVSETDPELPEMLGDPAAASNPVPPMPPAPAARGRGHKRHRNRSRTRGREPISAQERRYRAARRRANLKLFFYTHFVVYLSVLALLVVTTRSFRVLMIVALSWGVGVFLHYFWSLIAPQLRESLIQREVGERVESDVSSERRKVETRHVRSLEDLSASIAHEIRNPITAAKSLVQQMGEDPVATGNIEYASVALEELDRVERSISHLLRFARDEEINAAPIEMADVVDSALDTARDRIAKLGVDLECQLDTRGAMRGDSEKLRRVVINLVSNALDAMEEAGTASPRLQVMSGDNLAGTEVWLRVRDNGPGMDPETRAKIFDPFYTTKRAGTGLGLALSRKVVDSHAGTLEVDSSPETGTEFVLSFPKDARTKGEKA